MATIYKGGSSYIIIDNLKSETSKKEGPPNKTNLSSQVKVLAESPSDHEDITGDLDMSKNQPCRFVITPSLRIH